MNNLYCYASAGSSRKPIASTTAHPTWRLGTAAYGLTKNDVDCAW